MIMRKLLTIWIAIPSRVCGIHGERLDKPIQPPRREKHIHSNQSHYFELGFLISRLIPTKSALGTGHATVVLGYANSGLSEDVSNYDARIIGFTHEKQK